MLKRRRPRIIYPGMSLDVIIGLQRGDEGKGRFVDLKAIDYDVVARSNGGSNAGHTVIPGESEEHLALHQVPSGVAYPGKINVIGAGVYLDPERLSQEVAEIRQAGLKVNPDNLKISSSAHLVLPHHKILDERRESSAGAQGSTKAGIAYVAADKYLREGVRFEMIENPAGLEARVKAGLKTAYEQTGETDKKTNDTAINEQAAKWLKNALEFKDYMTDTTAFVNHEIREGRSVLAEGAQAFWLDINHGMYPAVTSSSTTATGLLDGLGLAPKHIGKVIGVTKAVKSHVGGGPLVTEIKDEELAATVRGPLGKTDSEYGVTTKRPRRIGYPDLVELRNAIVVNGVDEIAISKLDHVPRYGKTVKVAVNYELNGETLKFAPTSAISLNKCKAIYQELPTWQEDISGIRKFEDLPQAAQDFVTMIEKQLEVPVTLIGVGPHRDQVIKKNT